MMKRRTSTCASLLAASLWFCAGLVVTAQDIGTELCACQPTDYTFTLNFALNCADRSIMNGVNGVSEAICVVKDENQLEVDDPVPVIVSNILITELNQDLGILKQGSLDGPFVEGDSVMFTSILGEGNADQLTDVTLPRGLQMSVTGENAAGVTIINTWVILYQNDCTTFPVLTDGNQIGWTVFSELTPPPVETCPVAADTPSMTPVIASPGPAPTATPVAMESGGPTRPPVDTPAKSEAPSDMPSDAPSDVPSDFPSDFQSDVPSDVPSDAPSDVPSDAPSDVPSDIPSSAPGATPTPAEEEECFSSSKSKNSKSIKGSKSKHLKGKGSKGSKKKCKASKGSSKGKSSKVKSAKVSKISFSSKNKSPKAEIKSSTMSSKGATSDKLPKSIKAEKSDKGPKSEKMAKGDSSSKENKKLTKGASGRLLR